MGKLTELYIKNLKIPKDVGDHLDGKGLYLVLSPKGLKRWVYRYRLKIGDKWSERTSTLGHYPGLSLSQARKERASQEALRAAGKDPATRRKQEKKQQREEITRTMEKERQTFRALAEQWHHNKIPGYRGKDTAKRVWGVMEYHLLPSLGKRPVSEIQPMELLTLLHSVQENGTDYTARKRMLPYLKQIFNLAKVSGLITSNPADGLEVGLKSAPQTTKEGHKPFPLPELPSLIQKVIASSSHHKTKTAMLLVIYTAARPGEVCGAKWSEFDLEKGVWNMGATTDGTPAKTKNGMEQIHPLARQSIALLQSLKPYQRGEDSYLFPGRNDPIDSHLATDSLRSAFIEKFGYQKIGSVHGIRKTFSSAANETKFFDQVSFNGETIERQLSHGDDDRVRATYNLATYQAQRIQLAQWWADWVEAMAQTGELPPPENYLP